jgi:hypothetical protein
MSTSAQIPVFAPDGTRGFVPYENLHDAVTKGGGTIGVTIKAPDGTLGAVPADKVRDAVAAGGTIIPYGHEGQAKVEAATHEAVDNIVPSVQMAMGGGGIVKGGQVAGKAAISAIPAVVSKVQEVTKPLADAGLTNPDLVGLVSPRLAHAQKLASAFAKVAGKAAPEITPAAAPVAEAVAPAVATAEPAAALAKVPAKLVRASQALGPNAKVLNQAESLRQPVADVVDSIVPEKTAANIRTQSKVDYALKQGDVAGAEKALDQGAKQSTPSWQPPDRKPVPTVNEIRERVLKASRDADALDDHGVQQQMNWDLERHGYAAESEARREFIARNSTGVTKSDLVKAAQEASGKGSQVADSATAPQDLTSEWQKNLDHVKKQQAAKRQKMKR